jgi:hypothetical protein
VDNCGKPESIEDMVTSPAGVDRRSRKPRSGSATTCLRACSGCAGDYEDPDGRAWAPDESGGDEREDEADHFAEEFPAEEQ